MKKKIFILILVLSLIPVGFVEARKEDSLRIIFTHDLHDHIEAFEKAREDGEIVNLGGYERLKTLVEDQRSKGDFLLVDGGDFSMGTLFQTIYEEEAPSLRILGEIGYDAVTLGNHEFDFRARGLGNMLNRAVESEEDLPEIVFSNGDFENQEGLVAEDLEFLKKAFTSYGVRDYTVVEKNGLKIGIFGILGYEAISNAPMAGLNFRDPIEAARETVAVLREKEKVDMVVALSHSGTKSKKSKSEDEILAKKVKGIDFIVSGHTHRRLDQPIVVNGTIIGSSGRYSEAVGLVDLKRTSAGWELENYELIDLDEKVEASKIDKIDDFKRTIDKNYLSKFSYDYDEVLAQSSFNFTPSSLIGRELEEDILANLISDAFKNIVERETGKAVDLAIVPAGTIRDSFTKGSITVSEIFNVNSLGIGEDGISGYPLVSVYLTGRELKAVAEVDGSISPIMKEAQLYVSGLNYKINRSRLPLNKLEEIYLEKDGVLEEIDDKKLYHLVAGLYTGQMLSVVEEKSLGLLSIIPKDENGRKIESLESRIIYKDSSELKEWYAVAEYIKSFGGQIPLEYREKRGGKLVVEDRTIRGLFGSPSQTMKKIYGFFLGLFSLAAILTFYRKKKTA